MTGEHVRQPQLELKDLRLVEAIVDEGGVTHAARVLHLTQSAVSHHLSRLEERLGVQLFRRQGRGLVPTPHAKRLQQTSREVHRQVLHVEDELLQRPQRKRLTMATQCYTAYHWLPPLMRAFADVHPDVELRIDLPATRRPYEATLDDKLDLALVHTLPSAVGADHTVVRLFDDPFVLVVAPEHPLAAVDEVDAAAISKEQLLLYTMPSAHLEALGKELFGKQLPRRVQRLPLTEAILELVRSQQGVSLMSRWAVTPAVERGDLAMVPLSTSRAVRTWSAVFATNHPRAEVLHDLVGCMLSSGVFPTG